MIVPVFVNCSTARDGEWTKAGHDNDPWGVRDDRCRRCAGVSRMPRRLGRVVVLSERRAPRRHAPGSALDNLLGSRSLGVFYQPILARRVGRDGIGRWRVVGAEALVRAGDGGAVLRPAQFLPEIERAGLMTPLFQFVLAESLAAMLEWQRDHGLTLGVGVNLHTGALLDDALPGFLEGLLDATGVAPWRLTLELTEHAPIADLRLAAANLRRLRRVGVRTALDDFGAGFSTATRLAWLECDELKIDRVLVQGLEHSDEQRCVVESLIELAHGRGMTACAEGVETHAALRLLAAFGCDRVQGFVVARPAPAAKFVERAREWEARALFTGVDEDRQLALPGFGLPLAGGDHDALA
jgi:EAL domain-containing protein (putative c-di-GMP-specific phosphodiesterase class I)